MMQHPGEIVFEDLDRGRRESVPAVDVPDSVAFAEVGDARVPVVRVVAHRDGSTVYLRAYDADGRLLRSTIGPDQPAG